MSDEYITLLARAHAAYFEARALLESGRFYRRIRSKPGAVVIWNFHSISPRRHPFWPSLHPKEFDKLLTYLIPRFAITTINRICEMSQSRQPFAVLSFDDGLYDFMEYAMPVLDKYRLAANVNIVTECATTGIPFWSLRLYDVLAAAPRHFFENLTVPGFAPPIPRNDYRAARYGLALAQRLMSMPRERRLQILNAIEARCPSYEPTRMLMAREISELARSQEIGSHSHSHENMAHATPEFFSADLEASVRWFRCNLDFAPRVYAFPYGSATAEQIRVVLSERFQFVLLTGERINASAQPILGRITVYGESQGERRLRCLGFAARGQEPRANV